MVINDFHGKSLFLDTAPLIYFIEGNSSYQEILLNLFTSVDKKRIIFSDINHYSFRGFG